MIFKSVATEINHDKNIPLAQSKHDIYVTGQTLNHMDAERTRVQDVRCRYWVRNTISWVIFGGWRNDGTSNMSQT